MNEEGKNCDVCGKRRYKKIITILVTVILFIVLGYIATIQETFSEINSSTREIRTKTRHAFVFENEWKYSRGRPHRAAKLRGIGEDEKWLCFSHITKGLLHTSRACSIIDPIPSPGSGITGRWVMPQDWSMAIELNLRPDGTYQQFFFSDMAGSNGTTTGSYLFDEKSGILTYANSKFRRASVNGIELLIRDDSWNGWKEKKEIYVALIKISEEPYHHKETITEGDPILGKLYSNGVSER